jgi:hypothetical protein
MRRSLWWALGTSVGLSAIMLWLPDVATPPAVPAVDRSQPYGSRPTERSASDALRTNGPLPASLPAWSIDVARRDPFAVYSPTPSPAPAEPPPVKKPQRPLPPAEPRPAAPAVTYRFLGRMLTPDGQMITLLGRDEQSIEIKSGQMLDDGYKVEAITDQAVRLVYPPLGTVVEVAIPQPNSR